MKSIILFLLLFSCKVSNSDSTYVGSCAVTDAGAWHCQDHYGREIRTNPPWKRCSWRTNEPGYTMTGYIRNADSSPVDCSAFTATVVLDRNKDTIAWSLRGGPEGALSFALALHAEPQVNP